MHGDGGCLSTPLSRGDRKVVLRDQTEEGSGSMTNTDLYLTHH